MLEKLVRFSEIVGNLKKTARSGWISQVEVTAPESVADHSFRCAILAMCIGDYAGIDTEKLVRMLLLHDIHEALTGDYDHSVKRKVGLSRVKSREKTALRDLLSLLPPTLERRYLSLWEEFEERRTREAVMANEIDKLELILQALEYEREGYDPENFEVFWTEVHNKMHTPVIHGFFELLKRKRRMMATS